MRIAIYLPLTFLIFFFNLKASAQNKSSAAVMAGTRKPAAVRNAEEMVKEGYRRYNIEKGIIEFKIEGTVTGKETIYFEQWGWLEARHIDTEAKSGNFYQKENKVQYLDGEKRYDYDPVKNEATLFESPQVQQAASRYNTKDMVKVGIEMMKNMGGVQAGTIQFAGETCEVWRIERYKTKLLMWKGLTLKEDSFAGNLPVMRYAVEIIKDKNPPRDKLLLPKAARIVRK
jgi:hypothetical protein